MGDKPFSVDSYVSARRSYGITSDKDVTRTAERQARATGKLNEIVDPGINPMRYSKIRLNPHRKMWITTMGCPMDIEVSCDTTGSMGGEVDTEMKILPKLYEAIARVLPGYDPQLCLGIFGDVVDDFVLCRPQFEMEAEKIVRYLKEMAPQRAGGDSPEDPQYAMFARAYLTNAYTNRIGLKGYHFIVTDATCHGSIRRQDLQRIFGNNVFENDLKNMREIPSFKKVIKDLKAKTHQFILVVGSRSSTYEYWREACGKKSVVRISTTRQLPEVISAIIGLTEGTVDITDIGNTVACHCDSSTIYDLNNIEIGAQAKLRQALPFPIPKIGDIFRTKEDLWPIQPDEKVGDEEKPSTEIEYL